MSERFLYKQFYNENIYRHASLAFLSLKYYRFSCAIESIYLIHLLHDVQQNVFFYHNRCSYSRFLVRCCFFCCVPPMMSMGYNTVSIESVIPHFLTQKEEQEATEDFCTVSWPLTHLSLTSGHSVCLLSAELGILLDCECVTTL